MSDTHKFNLREWLVPPVLFGDKERTVLKSEFSCRAGPTWLFKLRSTVR
jgi:hypothetical protein